MATSWQLAGWLFFAGWVALAGVYSLQVEPFKKPGKKKPPKTQKTGKTGAKSNNNKKDAVRKRVAGYFLRNNVRVKVKARKYQKKASSRGMNDAVEEDATGAQRVVLKVPEVYDQGALGSCVANVMAMAMRLAFIDISGGADLDVSRMWLYYIARLNQNKATPGCDPDAMLSAINQYGFVPEGEWPYKVSDKKEGDPYTYTLPSEDFWAKAKYNGGRYLGRNGWIAEEITSVQQIVESVDAGLPVMCGLHTGGNFDTVFFNDSGKVVPADTDEGGHFVLIVGYVRGADGQISDLVILNSWGQDYGQKGTADMDVAHFDKLAALYRFRFLQGGLGVGTPL